MRKLMGRRFGRFFNNLKEQLNLPVVSEQTNPNLTVKKESNLSAQEIREAPDELPSTPPQEEPSLPDTPEPMFPDTPEPEPVKTPEPNE